MDGHDPLPMVEAAPANEDVFPAAEIQKRIWREWTQALQSAEALTTTFRWRIGGPLSEALVRAALERLTERHEILRTRFREQDGALVQVVRPTAPAALRVAHFQDTPDPAAAADAACFADGREPFAGPEQLWRASLFFEGEASAVFQLRLHSILLDGWSVGILIEEFAQLLAEVAGAAPANLPDVEMHFGDFARYQAALAASPSALEAERSHWARTLRGAEGLQFPADRPRATTRAGASVIRSILVERALTDKLAEISRRQGGTLFSAAAAAFGACVARAAGVSDVVLGSHSAGRDEVGLERVVGPVYNAIVLRLDASGDPTLSEFARHASDVVRAALAHQRLPFERAVAAAGLEPSAQQSLLRVNVALQKGYSAKVEGKAYGPFRFTPIPSPPTASLYEINAFAIERAEGWRFSIEADTSLFDEATVDALLAFWTDTLERLCAETPPRISALTPPATLERGKPARRLARTAGEGPPARILAIQPAGRRPPLFVFNGSGIYHALAAAMGPEQPILASALYDPNKPVPYKERPFEQLAAEHVRSIRLRQPRGPYFLGGYCVSGCLAYEAARQLRAAGEEVGFVAIFDAWAPRFIVTRTPWERAWIRLNLRAATRVSQLRRMARGEIGVGQVAATIGLLTRTGLIERLYALGLPRSGVESDPFGTPWYLEHFERAKQAFTPRPLDADVFVFASREYHTPLLEPYGLGWRPLLGERLRLAPTPGGHFSMLQIGAKAIAARLQAALRERTS